MQALIKLHETAISFKNSITLWWTGRHSVILLAGAMHFLTSGTGRPRRIVSTRRELAVMSQTKPLWYSGSKFSSPLRF